MRNLLDFLAKYSYWFVFLLLEGVSVALLFGYNRYQSSVWFSSANAVAGKVYEADAAVRSFLSMAQVNDSLTRRNMQLEREAHLLSEKLYEATHDSTLMHGEQAELLEGYRLIPAKVISNSIDNPDNLITLDKGTADGVREDMGVAGGNGAVGIVYMASAHYSVVIPLLNSRSRLSCAIKGRGYFGYMRWDGKRPQYAYVDDIPRHARFHIGDEVVTSGYSSMFPPGILVGHVEHVFNSPDGLSFRLQVRLSTDFGKLRDVCVIDDAKMRERLDILHAAQDSIQLSKE